MTDSDLSSEQIAEALKFIVHFVGDITQPLHDEAYETGGNGVDVTYQGSCTTDGGARRIWTKYLLTRAT